MSNATTSNMRPIIILLIVSGTAAISYNLPKFCRNATWYANSTIFPNGSTYDFKAYSIFVNTNNTVYISSRSMNQILMWFEGDIQPRITILINLNKPSALFVTDNGDIYADQGVSSRIDKATMNASSSVTVMSTPGSCTGLFVDNNNTLYCSVFNSHQVYAKSLGTTSNKIVAGTGNGSPGSTPGMLSGPHGIFVDSNFRLYVADCGNNRIQSFQSGSLTGTIVVANGSLSGIVSLNCPTGVVLDADSYLFIVDRSGSRIVEYGFNSFRCLVGCTGMSGSLSTILDNPETLSFDSYGNMYVTGRQTGGIQKFILEPNSCDDSTTSKRPETTSQRPKTTSQRPEATSQRLETTPQRQETTPQRLETTSQRPEATSQRPEAMSQRPETTSQRPDATAQQPETTSQRPEPTSQRLETTSILIKLSTITIQPTDSATTTLNATIATAIESTSVAYVTSQVTPSPSSFFTPTCLNRTRIGIHCNLSATPCDLPNLCQNNATCINTNISYICHCLPGFNGTECQFDHRPCTSDTCWNNGICRELTNTTFNCTCAFHWTGVHCETKINYCKNIVCHNNGVCRPLLGDYKCECLGDSFSGRHCETIARKSAVHVAVSKLFASIAILAGSSVIIFVVIMDMLKYCFDIDPARNELERIRRKKRREKMKRPIVITYIYKNSSPVSEPQDTVKDKTTV